MSKKNTKINPVQLDLFGVTPIAKENKRQSLQVRLLNLQEALEQTLPRDVDTILYIERQIANTTRELESLNGNG